MMQADTLSTATSSDRQKRHGSVSEEIVTIDWRKFPAWTVWVWRAVPILFGLAAYLPQIWTSLQALGRFGSNGLEPVASNALLQGFVGGLSGQAGLNVAGAILAGLVAYGVWALARALGAPRPAAAIVASLSLIGPLFGFAPALALSLDDGVFAAFMTLALAATVCAGRREDSNFLMLAFVLGIIAALVRPGAAWPALAIGLAAFCASRNLEEGPWVGALSSLCWAPGLYMAQHILADEDRPASLTGPNQTPPLSAQLQDGARVGVGAVDAAALSLPMVLNSLLNALPFLIFGAAAIFGLVIVYLLGKGRRRGAIAAGIGIGAAILGGAGYGDLAAARMLLDPLFLGAAATIGLVWPALLQRLQAKRAPKTGEMK